jgi:hypothetical protein
MRKKREGRIPPSPPAETQYGPSKRSGDKLDTSRVFLKKVRQLKK